MFPSGNGVLVSARQIVTDAIAPNTVSEVANVLTAGNLSLTAGVETTAATLTSIDCDDAQTVLLYAEFVNNDGTFGRNFDVNLYDSVDGLIYSRSGINVSNQGMFNEVYPYTPSSGGNHTFTLKVTCPSATIIKARQVTAVILKR
jgi:hypothetical protein